MMRISGWIQFGLIALTATSLGHAQSGKLTADEQNTMAIFREARRGVVYIAARATMRSPFDQHTNGTIETSAGTGFVIDQEGRVLTAYHIIENRDEITVTSGTKQVVARLVGTAPQLDIALLQIDVPRDELFPLPLGSSQDLAVGQKVMAIGNAAGLDNSLTVGVVSAVKRSLEDAAMELQESFIQTDAAINPGNSGGPLLNSAGQVIGINDAILKNTQNMGFAIPIDLAKSVLPDLIEMGHPYRPMLGFTGSEVTSTIAALFGLPVKHGFLVEEVLPGSPAQAAGLRAGSRMVTITDKPHVLGGDIIVAVNGEPFTSAVQLAQTLLRSRPGQELRFSVYRQGRTLDIELPLEKMQMQF
ncbi:MAG: trypsin-like peptidase domain-containing protein [Acidobacteria bacterium]|nr:trypsin-like peptidase domain-containing protein [Acidobacteriota bacterium]